MNVKWRPVSGQARREQHGSTSEIDSIAKAVVFHAGGRCTLRPKIS